MMQVPKLRLVLAAIVIAAGLAGVASTAIATTQADTVLFIATGDGSGTDDTPWD
jgi:hypothetical protein